MIDLAGKKVQVYFNLHKKVFSIRDAKTRLVIAHLNKICLENVVYKVSQSGRNKVLREQRKNVHAYVEGIITGCKTIEKNTTGVTYNPYKGSSFVLRSSNNAIYESDTCFMEVTNKIPKVYCSM